jgi:menaquinol-cytochrome c reductase iron-sulfur subunit
MADAPAPSGDPRRTFILKALNLAIGGAIGVALGVQLIRYLVFPAAAGRKIVRGSEGKVPVANDADLKEAEPLRVELIAPAVRDAWSKITNVPFGAAWLVRGKDGKPKALSTTCPHLGCSIDYNPSEKRFECPCHTSAFALDGSRIKGPTRRGMYDLDAEVDGKTQKILVALSPGSGQKGG